MKEWLIMECHWIVIECHWCGKRNYLIPDGTRWKLVIECDCKDNHE